MEKEEFLDPDSLEAIIAEKCRMPKISERSRLYVLKNLRFDKFITDSIFRVLEIEREETLKGKKICT